MRESSIINIDNLSVSLQKKPILHTINFSVQKGEIVCILGANGSGKSTLLKAILGIVEYSGHILLNGLESAHLSNFARSKLLSYVPQIQYTSLPFSLLEIVIMGRFTRAPLFSYSKQDKQKAIEVLERFGIAHLAHNNFTTLSGGQRQLGLIARALVQESEILVLDEPVSALDISYSFTLLEIIKSLQKTILLTSHHPEQCFIAHKVLMIKQGRTLVYDNADNALRESHINALYDIHSTRIDLPNNGRYFCQISNYKESNND